MYRLLLGVLALVACLAWAGSSALAQGGDEFQLPPVKLKPDRPAQAKPIPPTPDERVAPPAETPKETPPPETPKPPAKVAPPAEAPKVVPPAETPKVEPPPVEAPKVAPKIEPPPTVPAETPKKPLTLDLPAEPPAETPPPVLAKPARTPAKTPAKAPTPLDLPLEPALPPPVTPKPANPPDLTLPAPKPGDIQKELVEAQIEPQPEVDLKGMGEVGLVEEVARTRKAYGRALTSLKDYYMSRGNVAKIEWIDSELAAYDKVPKIQYLVVAELASPNLRPSRRIAAADQLYKEGLNYKDYPAFPPGKKDYLKVALEKFETIILKYPESDKIADAAFRMGEIYGGWYFEDWSRAVQSYERCWQWDPATLHPALFNAAKIYDEKLKNRAKAVELYNRVVADGKDPDLGKQSQDRIRALTGK